MCKPVAAGALDVHEVRVGVLEPLQLVPSLLLVVGGGGANPWPEAFRLL